MQIKSGKVLLFAINFKYNINIILLIVIIQKPPVTCKDELLVGLEAKEVNLPGT